MERRKLWLFTYIFYLISSLSECPKGTKRICLKLKESSRLPGTGLTIIDIMDSRSFIVFIPRILFAILVLIQLLNLVIGSDPDSDSLKNALDFVKRRQRDLQLQENDYYGQPEDIGYGYQKNFGIFENGPARELGSPDSAGGFRNILYDYENGNQAGLNKRKSNFRERLTNSGDLVIQTDKGNNRAGRGDIQCSYTRSLKDLWCNYRQSRKGDVNIEDLTPDQVAEILDTVDDKDREEADAYEDSIFNANEPYQAIPLRSRRNYRVFDRLDEKKRYPSFGEGFYGKRNPLSQRLNYENPPESEFLYALKFINPDLNREAVENMKETGYDVLNDEKDRDIIRILNDADNSPGDRREETYWTKKVEPEDEFWLQGPVPYPSDNAYVYESEKRTSPDDELWFAPEPASQPSDDSYLFDSNKRTAPKIFKQHNGIHLNNKRIPVKRSSIRSKKEATTDEKATQELKGIFEGQKTTTAPPKKKETKKPNETPKKMNVTKPEVTKHRDIKKLVRRANDFTKEQIYPLKKSNEIEKIFNAQKVSKKSIDWSQYFGYDKRSQQWLKDDSIRRAENLFLTPKSKRYTGDIENANYWGKSQYEQSLKTKIFNNKSKFSDNMDKNIDNMERKLGNIEEKIIDDAVKYTGAHTGGPDEDLGKVKSEIVHHLEAAYSLEKMKSALEDFKNSMKPEKDFKVAEDVNKMGTESMKTISPFATVGTANPKPEKSDTDKSKRVSTKKEIEDVYGKDNLDFLNWPKAKNNQFFPNQKDKFEECPILKKNINNCLQVEEISGKYTELLLPVCSLQQICYACGPEVGFSKSSTCDLMYITEAENLCQEDQDCLVTARDSMFALRDLHEQNMSDGGGNRLSGSCLYDPCIQKFFFNSARAVYR